MKPGSIPKVEELFGAGMPARTKLSRFGGFWRTEVGTLNQIIHVWPYKDVNERDHVRAEAIRTGVWPPKIADIHPRDGEQDPPSPRRSRRISSRASMAPSTSSAPTPTVRAPSPR